MAIKCVPLGVNREKIQKKVKEERDEGGGFLFSKSEPEEISYFCLLGFPCVHLKYKAQKTVNKTTVMEETSTIIEPWLGEGRTNAPNEAAAAQVERRGFSQRQTGYYIPWSVPDENPEAFVENFLMSTQNKKPDPDDFKIRDIGYLPRFIVKLEKNGDERYLVYDFKGEKTKLISERLSGDPYYRERIEKNMTEIP